MPFISTPMPFRPFIPPIPLEVFAPKFVTMPGLRAVRLCRIAESLEGSVDVIETSDMDISDSLGVASRVWCESATLDTFGTVRLRLSRSSILELRVL
jgi:hypothetical protein